MIPETDQPRSSELNVFRKVLRPLIRFALARRVPIQILIDLLKRLYVSTAIGEFGLEGRRLTDSRISVLTGLQRKDIKAIRASTGKDAMGTVSAGHLARLVAHWRGAAGYQDGQGAPLKLPRTGADPSFDTLVRVISHDIHPRTLLDDLLALGLVSVEDDMVVLIADAFLPHSDQDALLAYLAHNLGDHATAAVANVLAAPSPGAHFERAVHYNHLSESSLNELESLSRRLLQQALEQINARAIELQDRDKGDAATTNRFRCGAFVFCEDSNDPPARTSAQ